MKFSEEYLRYIQLRFKWIGDDLIRFGYIKDDEKKDRVKKGQNDDKFIKNINKPTSFFSLCRLFADVIYKFSGATFEKIGICSIKFSNFIRRGVNK